MSGDPWSKDNGPDCLDLAKASKKLWNLTEAQDALKDDYAKARLILDQDGERRKQALSRGVVRSGIDSMAKAEHAARTDAKYLEDMQRLDQDFLEAEKVRITWFAIETKVDALRTLISAAKATIQNT